MKQYLSIALTLACAVLVISLFVMKSGDNTQHENDAGVISDFSNRLDSAQTEIAFGNGRILILSNSLDESWSAALTFSNHLMEAQSTVTRDAEQITSLNQQVEEMKLENQALGQRVLDLTNQMASQVTALTNQIALTGASLNQANANYVLLENRLRRDVAERLVMQRKFYNLSELKAQMERLKEDPFIPQISEQSIYAGLDVEVQSNSFYVISPN
jgi:chromosome segregation ATPase